MNIKNFAINSHGNRMLSLDVVCELVLGRVLTFANIIRTFMA